jgi:hypothetical protein
VLHKVMLAGEWLLCNTLNINVVYTRQLGQSITCLSLPLWERTDAQTARYLEWQRTQQATP